jgi:hypothetical protein
MRNAGRAVVFMGFVSAVAVWSGSAEAPSLRDRASRAIAQVGQGRPASSLAARGARETFDEVGVVNSGGEIVIGMASDDVGDGILAWTNRLGEAAPRGALLVSAQDAGQVAVFNTAGIPRFILDGNSGLLSASADMAEVFPSSTEGVAPGSVVTIDPARPGRLTVARTPYDHRVAGVVSGARDYRPGITLNAASADPGHVAVTLTGTVYCLASNANGLVRAGDLLTSSAVPGHAMRAGRTEKARGAILGKALEDLTSERGLVLILASLQ